MNKWVFRVRLNVSASSHNIISFGNMMTSSNGNIFRVAGPLRGEFFSLICAWIKAWVNKREAGDLRRHRAHYDGIVMKQFHTRGPCTVNARLPKVSCLNFGTFRTHASLDLMKYLLLFDGVNTTMITLHHKHKKPTTMIAIHHKHNI